MSKEYWRANVCYGNYSFIHLEEFSSRLVTIEFIIRRICKIRKHLWDNVVSTLLRIALEFHKRHLVKKILLSKNYNF